MLTKKFFNKKYIITGIIIVIAILGFSNTVYAVTAAWPSSVYSTGTVACIQVGRYCSSNCGASYGGTAMCGDYAGTGVTWSDYNNGGNACVAIGAYDVSNCAQMSGYTQPCNAYSYGGVALCKMYPPRSLTASNGGSQSILNWNVPIPVAKNLAISDYRIEYKLSIATAWTIFTDPVSTASTATVTGLTNGLTYNFRVSAINASGITQPSTTANATPVAPLPVVDGVCGVANETATATAPTTGLCLTGTASSVVGSGPWDWTCSGSNGGTTASCSAPILPIYNIVNISIQGNGTLGNCTINGAWTDTCQTHYSVPPNTSLTIRAVADSGSVFDHWSSYYGPCINSTNPVCDTGVITKDITLIANFKSSVIAGSCEIRDSYTSAPYQDASNVGTGYAKVNKPGINTILNLRSACSASDYATLLNSYCASNSNSVQQQVVTYDASGNVSSTGCGPFGCNFVSCPTKINGVFSPAAQPASAYKKSRNNFH